MKSDEALLEAFLGGDASAFDVLYARHERPLFGFLVRALNGDRAQAEDLLHQAFLSVLREAKRKPVGRVRALLFEVARNAAANTRRSSARSEAAPPVEVEPEQPDMALMKRQTAKELQAALSRLPTTLSEVWTLRASGLSYEEVARVLALPMGTVKSRLHEVVVRLREELTR